jgi:hypothetical protein
MYRFCATTDSSANGELLCRHQSHNFLDARTPRLAGRILCGPPLVTLSLSFTLSFSQFVLLVIAVELYTLQQIFLAVVMDV